MIAKALLAVPFLLLSANAAMLRAPEEETEIKPLDAVTVEREIIPQTGMPPEGRTVLAVDDHPLPPIEADAESEDNEGSGDRRLTVWCKTYCWWHSYYGYITYCCDHTGYCAYVYC